MNRRNFIKTSGFSLGALLVLPSFDSLSRSHSTSYTMIPPDQITVVTDRNLFALLSSDRQHWSLGDIAVTLHQDEQALAVDLHSPVENPKRVEMRWILPRGATTLCLGDQWERSYGDLRWGTVDAGRIMPWYFMEYDGKTTNGFGVRTGCNSLCYWNAAPGTLTLTLDVRSGGNGLNLGGRTLRAAEIIVLKGKEEDSPYLSTRKFCASMCTSPRLPKEPVYGINDWYFAYGNNSEELILEHATLMAGLAAGNQSRPFCVIDAGWAVEAPNISRNCWADDFSAPNSHFKDMSKLADKIKALGMRPGIWVRPLCGSVKDDKSMLMPGIPRMDSSKAPFLDPTIPENIRRIEHYFTLYRQWGYELIKHDFTTADLLGKWGFKMIETKDVTFGNWRFHDNTRTNAEIVLNLYRAIRDASADTYVLGCNTLSHLSAGLFELQRIGDDTSGVEWERTRKMGVNALGFRITQHKAFYSTDGDCVGLTTRVPWEKNKQWMRLLAESGTPLFISAQREAVGDEQRAFIRTSFAAASQPEPTGEPIDWMEHPCPSIWHLMGREVDFDWS